MSYEYKHAIKSELKHFHENMLPIGSWKYEQKLNELNEVYRKAEAFDEVIEASENIDNHIDFTEAIDEIVIRHKGCHL